MYKIFVVFIHFATIINIFASDHGSIVVNSGIHDVIHEHVSNNFTQGLIPSSNNDLMIYAFDVGQANFIALK